MWEMKDSFLGLVMQALWRRKKAVYYALSAISIAGNLSLLVGPTLQILILSHSRLLQAIGSLQTAASSFGSSQSALQAASAITTLQTHAWNALPHFRELVVQRSVLYVLLNLIVALIILKSGIFAEKKSFMQPTWMKQDEFCSVSNLQVLCGSHWLAPSYLQTVCSTMSNFADMSAGPSMRLQQYAHHHGRGNTTTRGSATIRDASTPLIQLKGHVSIRYLHNESAPAPAPTASSPKPSPAPSPPSLFTIEPLDELVQSMQPHHAPISEAPMSRHPLRKVATKVDLVQAVQARRRKESRVKAADQRMQQQIIKSGRSMQGVKDKHGLKEHNVIQSMKQQGKVGHGRGGMKGETEDESDGADNELSGQEFNERVDTFISKVKRNLTMQRKDSLNRLLGLY